MNKANAILRTYRQRLTTRLNTALEQGHRAFQAEFAGEVMRLLLQRSHTAPTSDEYIVYPEGTKMFRQNADSAFIVVEQKPQVRTIRFSHDIQVSNGLLRNHFRLSFPYVVFILPFETWIDSSDTSLHLSNPVVAYSTKSIRSLKDKVFHPNLPNISGFELCYGRDDYVGPISEQAEKLVGDFWQTAFSSDWSEAFDESAKYPEFSSLETWERASEDDPLFMLKVAWEEEEVTLQHLLGLAMTRSAGDSDIYHISQFTNAMVNGAITRAWDTVKDKLSGADAESLDNWLAGELTNLERE